MPESTLLEFALTGLTLEFGAFAIFPHSYRIHVGADPVEIEDWDGGNITFSLAGFSPGMYQISLTIIHFTMYSIDGIVSVIIVNSAPPEWTIIPTDQEINEGEAFSYQINATDLSGVAGYAVNDTVHFSIDSSGLITNATTLTSGVYWLNVTVVDIHGNEAFAVFKVTVVPIATTTTTTTTTTTQLPFDPLLLLAFGGGAVIVLIILVVILRRPRRE